MNQLILSITFFKDSLVIVVTFQYGSFFGMTIRSIQTLELERNSLAAQTYKYLAFHFALAEPSGYLEIDPHHPTSLNTEGSEWISYRGVPTALPLSHPPSGHSRRLHGIHWAIPSTATPIPVVKDRCH
jgi:hypothetical protein